MKWKINQLQNLSPEKFVKAVSSPDFEIETIKDINKRIAAREKSDYYGQCLKRRPKPIVQVRKKKT